MTDELKIHSDEPGDKVKVAVLVPTRDVSPSWFAYSLALATGYMAYNHPYVDLELYFNNGTLLPEQRTALARIALKEGADWTIWLDSDMRFPQNTFERLIAHKLPIVGANYSTRKMPAIEPTAYSAMRSEARVYTEETSTGLEKVISLGFGCICVHRSVYEAIPAPWFTLPWSPEELRHVCGEDIFFCRRAGDHGFDVMLDHDLSKEVYHIGNMEFGYKEAVAARPYIDQLKNEMISIDRMAVG